MDQKADQVKQLSIPWLRESADAVLDPLFAELQSCSQSCLTNIKRQVTRRHSHCSRKSPLSLGSISIFSGITTSVATNTRLTWKAYYPVSA